MDFSLIGKAEEQINLLADYTSGLKKENHELKQKLNSLKKDIVKMLPVKEVEALKTDHAKLLAEKNRLLSERDFLRKRVEKMIGSLDKVLESERAE